MDYRVNVVVKISIGVKSAGAWRQAHSSLIKKLYDIDQTPYSSIMAANILYSLPRLGGFSDDQA
jgi:hypothetical protein